MKSIQVANFDAPNAHKYSELKVLKSIGGWFIGTTYCIEPNGIAYPGSRDSNYFPTEELAQKAFDSLLSLEMPNGFPDAGVWSMRMCHELGMNVQYRYNP